jgi:hypothetical protein
MDINKLDVPETGSNQPKVMNTDIYADYDYIGGMIMTEVDTEIE